MKILVSNEWPRRKYILKWYIILIRAIIDIIIILTINDIE